MGSALYPIALSKAKHNAVVSAKVKTAHKVGPKRCFDGSREAAKLSPGGIAAETSRFSRMANAAVTGRSA